MTRTPRASATSTDVLRALTLQPSRRTALVATAALGAFALAGCGGSNDQASADADTDTAAATGDNVIGDPGAPVTVIEYASITCPHCKAFHEQVWPDLKSRYIDTGQVRFVFRELPTSPSALAMAGFLMARCAPDDKYFDILDILFERQNELVRAYQARTAREELLKIARPMGISDDAFDACVSNEAEIMRIQEIGDEGYRRFGVSGTPTFVIDNQSYPAMTIEQFAEIIDPMLD